MKWRGRRRSSNVRDDRNRRVSRGVPRGGGALGSIISFAFRTFGIKGVVALCAVGFVGAQLGLVDLSTLLGNGSEMGTGSPVQSSPEEADRYEFIEVVLADTEDIWSNQFQSIGKEYEEPQLSIYRQVAETEGCGLGDARMGPFYCPADKTIYIDLSFYDELASKFDAPGDFAQAYVVAHEVAHHVQNLLGIADRVAAKRGQPDYNEYSVRLELQADYFAGMWARRNQKYLEAGDIEEALRAAYQVGDDTIQERMQGRITPHTFTHGTSEQRMRWFQRGVELATMEGADTFSVRYEDL
ncbi:MAG: neutral zinc metallopeptidase [Pseudomonadota bacterium]